VTSTELVNAPGWIWLVAALAAVPGDGEVVGVTSIARDLSECHWPGNELRQAQKMLINGRTQAHGWSV
jgi:sensor histidine kinase regulating citrate/malate metabolism